jgi:hypothetical protein
MHAKLTLPAARRQRRGAEHALQELDAAVTTILGSD